MKWLARLGWGVGGVPATRSRCQSPVERGKLIYGLDDLCVNMKNSISPMHNMYWF